MKIIKTFSRISVLTLAVFLIAGFNKISHEENINGSYTKQNPKRNYIAEEIQKQEGIARFENILVFNLNQQNAVNGQSNFVKTATLLKLDNNAIVNLLKNKPENIILSIPTGNSTTIELELTSTQVFTDDFLKKSNYTPGLYYHGIIKGNRNSLVSVSFFKNLVMGIISTDEGNFVIGPLKNGGKSLSSDYIYYNDADMLVKSKFHCMTDDIKNFKGYNHPGIRVPHDGVQTSKPIRVYYVADYDMYLYFNSNQTNVENFISGAFVNVQTIYANESIPVAISGFGIFTSPDPYINLNSSDTILTLFGYETKDNFDGDLAQLLSTGHGGQLGGIAWINVLCQTYNPDDNSGRYSFCNIDTTYTPFPTYSWTVTVMTHEMGHNLASRHTHACVWPVLPGNGIGQIDSCYASSETCTPLTRPNFNGTIMSYCHLNGAINFLDGFGPLPHDTILFGYQLAICIDSALNISEQPAVYSLLQNYPNPFNPSTNIKFALPDEGFVTISLFDLTGREITKLINNKHYIQGVYSVSFDANLYKLASGVYLYRINVKNNNKQNYTDIKKMVYIK